MERPERETTNTNPGESWNQHDQAEALRSMVGRRKPEVPTEQIERRQDSTPQEAKKPANELSDYDSKTDSYDVISEPTAVTVAITGGKGGVGKSNICLNLAIALAQMKFKVLLIDANSGHGNADLMCGLNGYWNLEHAVKGVKPVDEILLKGPGGIRILPGAERLQSLTYDDLPESVQDEFTAIQQDYDFILLDAGIASEPAVRKLVSRADTAILVTSPEPTSIADNYALIKHLSATTADIRIVVNLTQSAQQAESVFDRIQQTTESFLNTHITFAGAVPIDKHVIQAVTDRQPFSVYSPDCVATECMRQMAELLNANRPRQRTNADDSLIRGSKNQRTAA